jgi:hypothetical protein
VRGSSQYRGTHGTRNVGKDLGLLSLRTDCVPSTPSPTLLDVANEVSGDVLVVDPARCLVQHHISGSRSLPVGRRVGGQSGRPKELSYPGSLVATIPIRTSRTRTCLEAPQCPCLAYVANRGESHWAARWESH